MSGGREGRVCADEGGGREGEYLANWEGSENEGVFSLYLSGGVGGGKEESGL